MTSHLMIMFYSMRSQESYLVVLRHHVSKISNISIGQVKAIRKLRHVRDQRLLRRAAYLQETETTLLYAAHRWSARKWDTYGVHTTGNKPNLMRSRGGKKGGIRSRLEKLVLPDDVKEPRSAINSAVPTLSTSSLMAPD